MLTVRNKDLTWPEELCQLAKNKALIDKSQTGQLLYLYYASYVSAVLVVVLKIMAICFLDSLFLFCLTLLKLMSTNVGIGR